MRPSQIEDPTISENFSWVRLLWSTSLLTALLYLGLGTLNWLQTNSTAATLSPGSWGVLKIFWGVGVFVIGSRRLQLLFNDNAPTFFPRKSSLGFFVVFRLVFAFVLGVFLVVLSAVLIEKFSIPPTYFREFARSSEALVVLMIPIWYVHAYGEEYFFRGFLQTRLLRSFSPITVFAVVAVVFASIHLPHAVGIFCRLAIYSIVCSWSVYRWGGLIFPVVTHGTLNAVSHLVYTPPFSDYYIELNRAIPSGFQLVGLCGALTLMFGLDSFLSRRSAANTL